MKPTKQNREPQQNPVLVFSITLTQKRVRPPFWIIHALSALHAELVRNRPPKAGEGEEWKWDGGQRNSERNRL